MLDAVANDRVGASELTDCVTKYYLSPTGLPITSGEIVKMRADLISRGTDKFARFMKKTIDGEGEFKTHCSFTGDNIGDGSQIKIRMFASVTKDDSPDTPEIIDPDEPDIPVNPPEEEEDDNKKDPEVTDPDTGEDKDPDHTGEDSGETPPPPTIGEVEVTPDPDDWDVPEEENPFAPYSSDIGEVEISPDPDDWGTGTEDPDPVPEPSPEPEPDSNPDESDDSSEKNAKFHLNRQYDVIWTSENDGFVMSVTDPIYEDTNLPDVIIAMVGDIFKIVNNLLECEFTEITKDQYEATVNARKKASGFYTSGCATCGTKNCEDCQFSCKATIYPEMGKAYICDGCSARHEGVRYYVENQILCPRCAYSLIIQEYTTITGPIDLCSMNCCLCMSDEMLIAVIDQIVESYNLPFNKVVGFVE